MASQLQNYIFHTKWGLLDRLRIPPSGSNKYLHMSINVCVGCVCLCVCEGVLGVWGVLDIGQAGKKKIFHVQDSSTMHYNRGGESRATTFSITFIKKN